MEKTNDFAAMGTTVSAEGQELEWDAKINKETDFVLLPPGDYMFTVTELKRERHEAKPGGKLPACNQATLTLRIEAPQGNALITYRLFLHSSMESMLTQFFAGLGLKKKGEPLQMDWTKVLGASGRAKVDIKTYNDNEYNEIKKIYPAEPVEPKKAFVAGQL